MVLETMMAMALGLGPESNKSQKERCAPNHASGTMMCVNRAGHCMDVVVDGQKTVALTDDATGRRVNAIEKYFDVCWQLPNPVSTKLRIRSGNGGIYPTYIGAIEKVDAQVYALDDFDPKVDSRLDQVNGVRLEPDGTPSGTWHLTSERPLKKGEYVLIVQTFGAGNWDRQAILVNLDPALQPGAVDKGGK